MFLHYSNTFSFKDFFCCRKISKILFLGAHDAEKLAEILLKDICKFDLGLKISGMKADNGSTNWKILQSLSQEVNMNFANDQILGCCAHVINQAAKPGVQTFGDD